MALTEKNEESVVFDGFDGDVRPKETCSSGCQTTHLQVYIPKSLCITNNSPQPIPKAPTGASASPLSAFTTLPCLNSLYVCIGILRNAVCIWVEVQNHGAQYNK